MQFIQVQFDQSNLEVATSQRPQKAYDYISRFDVAIGDRVLVDAPSTGLTTVTVVSMNEPAWRGQFKEIVATLADVQKAQRKRAKKQRKLEKAAAKLTAILAQAEQNAQFDEYAKQLKGNKAGLELLDEVRELNKQLA